jgi:branched-chain amino acid transport system ATP-binding protein
VLNFGRVLTEGKPGDVQNHPEVVAAYLGGEAEGDGPHPEEATGGAA